MTMLFKTESWQLGGYAVCGDRTHFRSKLLYASGVDTGFCSKMLHHKDSITYVQGRLHPTKVPWAKGVAPGLILGLGSSSVEGGSHSGL